MYIFVHREKSLYQIAAAHTQMDASSRNIKVRNARTAISEYIAQNPKEAEASKDLKVKN